MAISGKDTLRIRNEGAMWYDKMIGEMGYEKARAVLKSRTAAKMSIAVPEEEVTESSRAMIEILYNNLNIGFYTVMHDLFGIGKKRARRFKAEMDRYCVEIAKTGNDGHYYLSMVDAAERINALLDIGIDVQQAEDVEQENRGKRRPAIAIDVIIKFLREHGHKDAAEDVWNDLFGPHRAQTKEDLMDVRKMAKQKRKRDSSYKLPNMYLFCPDSIKTYMAMFMTAIGSRVKITEQQAVDILGDVNDMLEQILINGKDESDRIEEEFSDTFNLEVE